MGNDRKSTLRPLKKNKQAKPKKYEQISENSEPSSRVISSRGESRLLFGDINIEDLE
jgi:hypothetical protein